MGEDFQRKKKEAFEHRQDRGFRELKAPDIFSERPEVLSRAYTCELTNGSVVGGGDVLVACERPEGVQILRNGWEEVGTTRDAGLLEVLRATNGSHPVDFYAASSVFPSFEVRIANEGSKPEEMK